MRRWDAMIDSKKPQEVTAWWDFCFCEFWPMVQRHLVGTLSFTPEQARAMISRAMQSTAINYGIRTFPRRLYPEDDEQAWRNAPRVWAAFRTGVETSLLREPHEVDAALRVEWLRSMPRVLDNVLEASFRRVDRAASSYGPVLTDEQVERILTGIRENLPNIHDNFVSLPPIRARRGAVDLSAAYSVETVEFPGFNPPSAAFSRAPMPKVEDGSKNKVNYWPEIQRHLTTRYLTTRTDRVPAVTCPMCFSKLIVPGLQEATPEREIMALGSCGHVFGAQCIGAWWRGSQVGRCPLCVQEIHFVDQ